MTAADKREELEAAIWRRVHDSGARPIDLDRKGMDAILDAADAYATEVASEALDGVVRAARQRDRRDALNRAVAEIYPALEPIGRQS